MHKQATLTWRDLAQIEPGLLALERNTRSIARNAEWDWYLKWIRHCNRLGMLVGPHAQRPGLRGHDAFATALHHLLEVYEDERNHCGR